MANQRIYYAIEQVGIKPDASAAAFNTLRGVQSCGITTNYNVTQVFELGQLAIYANNEDLPDVQVSLSKALDSRPLIYHEATRAAVAPTLAGRSVAKCLVALAIFSDTDSSATGMPGSQVTCSGQFVASVAYRVGVNDNGTEDVTLAGNHKVWANDPRIVLGAPGVSFTGSFAGNNDTVSSNNLVRRQNIIFATTVTSGDNANFIADPDCTILPREVHGISTSGVNIVNSDGTYPAHVQSIAISCDFNRTSLNELGHLAPYTRYINFPVQVTTEINVISVSGDMVSATEGGILSTGGTGCVAFLGNLSDNTIRLATCEGTRVYAGMKNRLQSINYTGGDTGGGNVQVTYSYRNFNDFTVMHSGDPNANFTWANRAGYLIN